MSLITPIDDPQDARIESYLNIRERDLVGRDGLFIAEGRVVLEKLVTSPCCEPLSLLISDKRVASLAAITNALPDHVPVYAASQRVVDEIAGFPLHRGILAIGRRTSVPAAETLLARLPEQATILVLSAIANHDNLGGIFRNAAAFGVGAILLDSDCCDPLYRKSIRVSVGAALIVPFARIAGHDALFALLTKHGFASLALSPRGQSTLLELQPGDRNALFLGAEGPGLPDHLMRHATTVRIPMAGGFDSLNVATTSGIVLHHLASRT
jgi:tRNA G18 (ribose-2'-O)-methylase SpoU